MIKKFGKFPTVGGLSLRSIDKETGLFPLLLATPPHLLLSDKYLSLFELVIVQVLVVAPERNSRRSTRRTWPDPTSCLR